MTTCPLPYRHSQHPGCDGKPNAPTAGEMGCCDAVSVPPIDRNAEDIQGCERRRADVARQCARALQSDPEPFQQT